MTTKSKTIETYEKHNKELSDNLCGSAIGFRDYIEIMTLIDLMTTDLIRAVGEELINIKTRGSASEIRLKNEVKETQRQKLEAIINEIQK